MWMSIYRYYYQIEMLKMDGYCHTFKPVVKAYAILNDAIRNESTDRQEQAAAIRNTRVCPEDIEIVDIYLGVVL
ncbi:unnamed protein product [Lasius platythorax]|uniref:Uncharacterized protein n=1 Tax=Lasius platythorax TaxID=488582 RepID=A0AAV2NFN1_9HYME